MKIIDIESPVERLRLVRELKDGAWVYSIEGKIGNWPTYHRLWSCNDREKARKAYRNKIKHPQRPTGYRIAI